MMPVQTFLLIAIASVAVVTDIRSHRIPNVLCVLGIGAGLAVHFWNGGLVGLLSQGIGGLFCAGLVLLPLYVLGGMAAGDVKLMAAIGCIVGLPTALTAALYSLMSGTLLGLAYMVLRGGLRELRSRYWPALLVLVRTHRFVLARPAPGAASQSRFPYALAIAVGSLLAAQ